MDVSERDDIDKGDEGDAPPIPLHVLEEKYRQQMRQIFPTRIDLPLFGLANQIKEQIDLRPDFQRRDRWSDEKRSRFIESIIMNVPVPPVFLGEEEYGKYVVLDGRQRLTAAYKFLTDDLPLVDLKVWTELNGMTFSEMKKQGFGASIERRFLPAILLTRESSPQVKYEVFDRLNTGGIEASPMEVRNAVFPGKFKDQIVELSEDATFRALWGVPTTMPELESNALYRDMSDLELVLRFFALADGSLHGYRYKDWLSEFMSARNVAYDADATLPSKDATKFRQAVQNAFLVLGNDAFRRPDEGSGRRTRSAPYADAIMQALAPYETTQFDDEAVRSRVREALLTLATGDPDFRKAVSSGTNGDGAIGTRISSAKRAVENAIRPQSGG